MAGDVPWKVRPAAATSPLAGLSRMLAAGRVTSRRLVEECLANAAAASTRVAFTALHEARARAESDRIDAMRRSGAATPAFAGIPISIKDLFDEAGEVTTAGSRILAEAPPATRDACVVARLKAAGFIIVGRTNLSEFAYNALGLNPFYGDPLAPFERDRERVAGGSSSGSTCPPRHPDVCAGNPSAEELVFRRYEVFRMTISESRTGVVRLERDSLGEREIPADAYIGIQTLRAVENFSLSDIALSHFPPLVRALAMVKKAAAIANHATQQLEASKCSAIARACEDIIEGGLVEHFVVDVFQGGAGTSTNMNANEVIANRALEYLGRPKGEYGTLHPNDDVNMSQSTNDVYPTAVRLALLLSRADLQSALGGLIAAFERKGLEFADIVKIGRTQLQDAVPITLGQEFEAFAATLREDTARLDEVCSLFLEVNLGGTAVGTRINASRAYAERAIAELSGISGFDLRAASNLLEASWDTGAFVTFSGILRRIAVKLSKISNDLRLLSSGPRSGLGEIRLPAVQPGSSIMPGKVNPVIPESVNQVCYQVIGNDLSVTMAAEGGQLQLNAFEPLIVFNLLTSMRLLGRAMTNLAERCVTGIEANVERCRLGAEASISLATALVPLIGYGEAVEIAKEALAKGRPIIEVALSRGLDRAPLEELLDPMRMAVPLHGAELANPVANGLPSSP